MEGGRVEMDVIVDLQYGDCGKGKIAHFLCTTRKYTHVLRYNGGCNAGHTIFHKGKKFVTHHIPAGVFAGIPSVIGPGCVVDPEKFLEEITGLEEGGISAKTNVFVAKNVHVITAAHKAEDGKETKVGTTGQGNGPAYRDKFARTGVRAEHVLELQPFLVDLYDMWYSGKEVRVLAEGAQGFGLDIDWGDYPYVTSSHCTVGGAILNGIPHSAVKEVWGVAKMYETYVGKKDFQPKDEIFNKIGDVGEEFGATTGRRRQTNWMDMQLLEKAIRMNGVTHVVFNKVDVLRIAGAWAIIDEGKVVPFKGEEAMKSFITERLVKIGISAANIFFSENKEGI
ncbi:adenylosuccinate synthetase [Candidatus Kaiserbacteria bacterium]|nr:adenylosuccinate synthetase [Candidatus Kaiserbacteria bacterium]